MSLRLAAWASTLAAVAAQPAQQIFSNYGLLPANDWLTQGYSDVAYTNAGCDDQLFPQTGLGSVIGLGVRIFLPDTNTAANLWSVTNISIPLSRTSISTITSLANYEIVFYADNGVPQPITQTEIDALNLNVAIATFDPSVNPNQYYPLPGAKLFTAQFLNPSAVLTTSVQWFNLALDTSASCPQLPKNSWVWIQLAPKAPVTLASGNFYDGVRWLGAQNFLIPTPYTDPLQQPWGIGAGRLIMSTATVGDSAANSCSTPSGIASVKAPHWAGLSASRVPIAFTKYTTAYGLILAGYANDYGCFYPSATPTATSSSTSTRTVTATATTSASSASTSTATGTSTASSAATSTATGTSTASSPATASSASTRTATSTGSKSNDGRCAAGVNFNAQAPAVPALAGSCPVGGPIICARSSVQLAAIAAGQAVSPCSDGIFICQQNGDTPVWEFQSVAAGTACYQGLYIGLAGASQCAPCVPGPDNFATVSQVPTPPAPSATRSVPPSPSAPASIAPSATPTRGVTCDASVDFNGLVPAPPTLAGACPVGGPLVCARSSTQLALIAAGGSPVSPCADGFYICNADGATPSWEFQSVAAGTACVNGLYIGTAGVAECNKCIPGPANFRTVTATGLPTRSASSTVHPSPSVPPTFVPSASPSNAAVCASSLNFNQLVPPAPAINAERACPAGSPIICGRSDAQVAAIAAGQPVSPCADGFYICHAYGAVPFWEWQRVAVGTACVNGQYVGLDAHPECTSCLAGPGNFATTTSSLTASLSSTVHPSPSAPPTYVPSASPTNAGVCDASADFNALVPAAPALAGSCPVGGPIICARSPAQLAAIAAGRAASPCADGFYICHANGGALTWEWQPVAPGTACVNGLYVGLAAHPECNVCIPGPGNFRTATAAPTRSASPAPSFIAHCNASINFNAIVPAPPTGGCIAGSSSAVICARSSSQRDGIAAGLPVSPCADGVLVCNGNSSTYQWQPVTLGTGCAYGAIVDACSTADCGACVAGPANLPTSTPAPTPLPFSATRSKAPVPSPSAGSLSTDGTCGAPSSYRVCPNDLCCSSYGFCGSSAAYCNAGCQSGYGQCSLVATASASPAAPSASASVAPPASASAAPPASASAPPATRTATASVSASAPAAGTLHTCPAFGSAAPTCTGSSGFTCVWSNAAAKQAILSSGGAVSPCTDAYRFCPSYGQTYPVMPVSAGTACLGGQLVGASSPACAPCAAGQLVSYAGAGEGEVVITAEQPALVSAESASTPSAAAGPSAGVIGGAGVAGAFVVVAAAVAAVVLLRGRTPKPSGARIMPPALPLGDDSEVAMPAATAPAVGLESVSLDPISGSPRQSA